VIAAVRPHKLGELFAVPLQSAVRAQNLALQETVSFIEQFGFEKGEVKTFRFKAERVVEERRVDPETGIPETRFRVQPFEVSIPLLALIQPPSMQLQEMNVEFGVEVVETKSEAIDSAVIPRAVLGPSLASSRSFFTSLGQSNPATMKVSMKIVREVPEGMARIADTLTDLLSGVPQETEAPAGPAFSPIEELHGIGPEAGAMLRARGILTTADFLRATETPELRKELSNSIKVSLRRIERWREKARLLEKGKT